MQQALGLGAIDAVAHGDQIFVGHQFLHWLALIRGETHIPVGQNANQAARAFFHHRDPGNAMGLHQVQGVRQTLIGMDRNRVDHHASLKLLHPAHFVGLFGDAQILMDDAEATQLRHGDGQAMFGHSIHGRG